MSDIESMTKDEIAARRAELEERNRELDEKLETGFAQISARIDFAKAELARLRHDLDAERIKSDTLRLALARAGVDQALREDQLRLVRRELNLARSAGDHTARTFQVRTRPDGLLDMLDPEGVVHDGITQAELWLALFMNSNKETPK